MSTTTKNNNNNNNSTFNNNTIDVFISIIKLVIYVYDFLTLPYYYISSNVCERRRQADKRLYSKRENVADTNSAWKQDVNEEQQVRIERQIDSFANLPKMMQYAFKKNSKQFCYGYRELICEQYVPKAGGTPQVAASSNNAGDLNNNNNNSNTNHHHANNKPESNGSSNLVSSNGGGGGARKASAPKAVQQKMQRQVTLSDYKWYTFAEFEAQIEAAARGFLLEGIKAGDKVMLFSDTRAEWQIALQALLRINAIVGTMYATLGYDGIVHSVNETSVSHVIAQADKVTKLLSAKKDLPTLKKVIFFDNMLRMPKELGGRGAYRVEKEHHIEEHPLDGKSSLAPDVECVNFQRVLMRGYHLPVEHELIVENRKSVSDQDSVAVIMYTSGSTGQPKGVLLTHRNIMATIKSFSHVTRDFVREPHSNIGCAYLPLAHIFEFCLESMMLYHGVRFGFANPQTLTDSSPGLMPNQRGDVAMLRPTVIIMVPLVLDRIVSGVKAGIKARGYFREQLVSFLLDYKAYWVSQHYDTPLTNKLVCSKIAQALGGKLKFIICGSAPLSASTQNFIRQAFNIKLPQGFGTTETCAATACQHFDDNSTQNVGPPVAGCQIKLEEWAEAGYSPADKPNPRGEIVVGGDNIAKGYFKLEEQTKEAFYRDEKTGINWYRTGDIGEFLPNGNLKIIDRKKDLVKLQNGEYISLGKVESTLKSNPFTDNFCVYANSLHNYIVAVGPANEASITSLAKRLIRTYESRADSEEYYLIKHQGAAVDELKAMLAKMNEEVQFESDVKERVECFKRLCKNELILQHVLNHLTEKARDANLLSLEIPKKLVLVAEEWTEELNLVTAAMKIRRNFIYKRFESELNELYTKS